MEYRRRRNKRTHSAARGAKSARSYRKRKTGFDPSGIIGILLPCAAFAAVLWLILGTDLSDRLAERKGGSIFGFGSSLSGCSDKNTSVIGEDKTPIQTACPSPASETPGVESESAKVVLSRLELYMIQMGVYSSQENTAEQTEALKKAGAAGYVYNDNGSFRVIAAAFTDEQDAESVCDRLNSEGYSSTVFTLKVNGAELLITSEGSDLKAVKEAFDSASLSLKRIADITGVTDIDDNTKADVSAGLSTLLSGIETAASGIYRASQTNDMMRYLYSYLNDVSQLIRGFISSEYGSAELSSELKLLSIETGVRYSELLKQIGS